LDPNDHFDEDLFEADPVLDQPSYYCGIADPELVHGVI
jgi:hypothetical protein